MITTFSVQQNHIRTHKFEIGKNDTSMSSMVFKSPISYFSKHANPNENRLIRKLNNWWRLVLNSIVVNTHIGLPESSAICFYNFQYLFFIQSCVVWHICVYTQAQFILTLALCLTRICIFAIFDPTYI